MQPDENQKAGNTATSRFDSFESPVNVLVSGANRGIGRAIVEELVCQANVRTVFGAARAWGVDRAPDDELDGARLARGAKLIKVAMDVTDEASIVAARQDVAKETSRLDVILCCAGLLHDGERLQPEKQLAAVNAANLQRLFAVNAIGPLLVAKHFREFLPRKERCVVANLSARVGSICDNRLGGWYGYRGSKAAQNMFTKTLSVELRRHARGVICVALHPGTVDTDLSRPFGASAAERFSPSKAARQLLDVVAGLKDRDNGGFFAWDGTTIPW